MALFLNFFHNMICLVPIALKISDFPGFFSKNLSVDQKMAILGCLSSFASDKNQRENLHCVARKNNQKLLR